MRVYVWGVCVSTIAHVFTTYEIFTFYWYSCVARVTWLLTCMHRKEHFARAFTICLYPFFKCATCLMSHVKLESHTMSHTRPAVTSYSLSSGIRLYTTYAIVLYTIFAYSWVLAHVPWLMSMQILLVYPMAHVPWLMSMRISCTKRYHMLCIKGEEVMCGVLSVHSWTMNPIEDEVAHKGVLQYVAVCCDVLQCVVICFYTQLLLR